MANYLAGEVDTDVFCGEFEREYNFEATSGDLEGAEKEAFGALFDVVVRYTPKGKGLPGSWTP